MDTNRTMKLWAAHASGDASFPERGEIAFDWPAMGDLSALSPDREAFRRKFDAAYPDGNAANRSAVAGALYRLVHEMESGDYIACLYSENVGLGTVSGPYTFRDGAHVRPVRWIQQFPQAAFSRDAMRELTCSPVRLFAVKRFAGEFLSMIGVAYVEPEPAVKRTASRTPDAVPERVASASVPAPSARKCAFHAAGDAGPDTARFVLDALRRYLTREEFRQFAAGLLRAMGYAISVPPYGGLDEFQMTAQRDELFPPVLVHVRVSALEEADILRIRAAIEPGSFGLVITLRELSDGARQALRQSPYLRVVSGEELASLTLKYYCALDERYRAMIPLRMIYVPVS